MPKRKPLLSVIIPLKNTAEYHRDIKRLEDCLYSLKKQNVPFSQIDVIVSDLDSEPEFRKQHEKICKRFGARHIYTETGEAWNISRARNIGIRNAQADFVMTTDVDCVFMPDFVKTVLKHMGEGKIIHCRIGDLPGNYDGRLDDFLWMNKISILRPPFGYGGCQVFSKKWAFKVHGFDEAYSVWGADDTDFYLRATQDGLESIWIGRETSFFHQYHETLNNEKNRQYVNENRVRLKLVEMGKLPIVRNEAGWGGKAIKRAVPKKSRKRLDDVAVLITTFMRDSALFNCIRSIRKFYPDIAIFVSDNGRATARKKEFCRANKCTYVKAPFDCGVGATRNKVFEVMPKQYKYVVICEDDILFSEETALENWVTILEAESDISIAGGLLKKTDTKMFTIQNYEAWMYAKAATLYIEKIEQYDWKSTAGIRYAPCDIVINVFMMKREVWDSQKWDPNIKSWPEHEDFFLSLKKNTNWKVAYTDTVSLIHKPASYPEKYAKHRMRMEGIGYFAKKWGIEYIWNSWHKDWGKPNPMRIGVLEARKPARGKLPEKKEVAVGIKTLLREKAFFRCLDALQKHFPYSYRLYIADDGPISDDKEFIYQQLTLDGHEIIRLPRFCGLSIGRNSIIKRIREDYVLILDDDILLQDSESIKNMRAVLDSTKEIGLCSGMLFNEGGDFYKNENYQKGLRFEIDRGLLFRYPAHRNIHEANGAKFVYADQVVNFFLAKKAVFDEVVWDNQIKIEYEHMDFFLRLKDTKWKVVACLDARATHLNIEGERLYNEHRWAAPREYFLRKHSLHNTINRFH